MLFYFLHLWWFFKSMSERAAEEKTSRLARERPREAFGRNQKQVFFASSRDKEHLFSAVPLLLPEKSGLSCGL